MADSSSVTLGNCSIISHSNVFVDFVSEQKSFSARVAALQIQFKDLKNREGEFDADDLDLLNELTEYNLVRETVMDNIRSWYEKLGAQIGESSKETEQMENRSKRAHRVLQILKKKLSQTSPLGPEEQETRTNRLWLNEERTCFPPELLNRNAAGSRTGSGNEATTGRYQLRSMKKSISDALASPFRGLRSSTPDAPTKTGRKKESSGKDIQVGPNEEEEEGNELALEADLAAAAGELAAAVAKSSNGIGPEEEVRQDEKTTNISSAWPTMLEEKGGEKKSYNQLQWAKLKNHIENTFPTVILSRKKINKNMALYDVVCYLAKNNLTLIQHKKHTLKVEL